MLSEEMLADMDSSGGKMSLDSLYNTTPKDLRLYTYTR
jgi:hypothetical protein